MNVLIIVTIKGHSPEKKLWERATGPEGIGWLRVKEFPAVFEKPFGDHAKAVLLNESAPDPDIVEAFVRENYIARAVEFHSLFIAAHHNETWMRLKKDRHPKLHIAPLPHKEGSKVYQHVLQIVDDPTHSIEIFDDATRAITSWANYSERLKNLQHALSNLLGPVDLDLQNLVLGGFSEDRFAEVATRYAARKEPLKFATIKQQLTPIDPTEGKESVETVVTDIRLTIDFLPRVEKAWQKVEACFSGKLPVKWKDDEATDLIPYKNGPNLLSDIETIPEDLAESGKREAIKARFATYNPFSQWFTLLDDAMTELIEAVDAIPKASDAVPE